MLNPLPEHMKGGGGFTYICVSILGSIAKGTLVPMIFRMLYIPTFIYS